MTRIVLRLAIVAVATLLTAASAAQAPYYYETDNFYIRATGRDDIRIGVKNGLRLALSRKGEAKQEVKFYDAARVPEGYSTGRDDVSDPDFIINDMRTEMIVEDRGEGRDLAYALWWLRGAVRIEVRVEDNEQARALSPAQSSMGFRTVLFTLPDAERRALLKVIHW